MDKDNKIMKIITRAEAKARGLKRYFTNTPCKHGHISERSVSDFKCYECKRLRGVDYYYRNQELELKKKKEKRDNDLEVIKKRAEKKKFKEAEDGHKQCHVCEKIKSLDKFYIRKDTSKILNQCRECVSKKRKEFRENNKELVRKQKQRYSRENKELIALKNKKWREENQETVKKKNKEWREKNREYVYQKNKEYYSNKRSEILKQKAEYGQRTKEQHNRCKRRIAGTPRGRVVQFSRGSLKRIINAIKENKYIKTIESLNYTMDELKFHIENKFEDGMSWDNHGEWHIDHIMPLSHLVEKHNDKTQEEILNIVNSLDNLQPLWASENLSKGAKMQE